LYYYRHLTCYCYKILSRLHKEQGKKEGFGTKA
jgi:hypothetical protein